VGIGVCAFQQCPVVVIWCRLEKISLIECHIRLFNREREKTVVAFITKQISIERESLSSNEIM
jgi:hypothetical protein